MTAKAALVLAFRGKPKPKRQRWPTIAKKAARLAVVRPGGARVVERLLDDLLAETAKYEYDEGA